MRHYNVARVEIKTRVQDTRLPPSCLPRSIRHFYKQTIEIHCFKFIIDRYILLSIVVCFEKLLQIKKIFSRNFFTFFLE